MQYICQMQNQKEMESIFTFLSEYSPSIGLIIVVAVAVYYITMYHVSIQNTKKKVDELPCDDHKKELSEVSTLAKNTKEKTDKLPCEKNEQKIDATIHLLDALMSKVADLPCGSHRKAIVNIENTLLSKRVFTPSLSVSLSPKRLTEIGRELYQISGIQTVLENNINHFIEKIEAFAPKTALDVQNYSLHVIFNSTDEDIFIPIKNWLYRNPVFYENDIDMADICYVASLELRDVYLTEHTELLLEIEVAEA